VSQLDEKLRRAHAALPVDLSDPAVFGDVGAQRRALATRLGLPVGQADDLSRWMLAHPDKFDAARLRCWRIASPTWLQVAGEQLEAVGQVQCPVALFVMPAVRGEGWQLSPVLSLDAIRLLVSLGGRVERDLRSAVVPAAVASELIERLNGHTLHAGPKECLDSAGQLAQELTRELGTPVAAGAPKDKRDRWGRLLITRRSYRGRDGTTTAELDLRVVTFPAREYPQRRLGAVRRDDRYRQASAVMDLGEAVQTAIERGLPLLLSTEAAGHLADTVRVGRMKGRPGALTITSSDGLSATTRRVVAEQAVSELRALKHTGAKITLDAGARQLVRMTLARPLADDPVLLGARPTTTTMTVSLHNRRKLEEATRRVLDGSASIADGKLTWKNVAAVAGVSKATADRAVDLRDEFRRQLEQHTPVPSARPDPVSRPRHELEHELARVRRENTELKQSTKVLHSVILAAHPGERAARSPPSTRRRRSRDARHRRAETKAKERGCVTR
jgi:hypothetical protein